jgi:hypothetical protein
MFNSFFIYFRYLFNYNLQIKDVWAVGVIFFIFLTGNMPFKEDKCNQIILNQVILNSVIFINKNKAKI